MKKVKLPLIKASIIALCALLCASAAAYEAPKDAPKKDANIELAMVYYPHWFASPIEAQFKHEGWCEWSLLKSAKKKFGAHRQPKIPYAYFDSANPKDVEKEIALASGAGVDVFLYCWYWYEGVMNLQEGLERGFLKAENNSDIKFALMWANHDRNDQFRPEYRKPRKLWFAAKHSEADTLKAMDYCISHYFNKPNYWRVGGKIYFAVYQPMRLVKHLGGAENTRRLFAAIDRKMAQASLPPIHWAGIASSPRHAEELKLAGFSSLTDYNLTPPYGDIDSDGKKGGIMQYSHLADLHRRHWADMTQNSPLVNLPVVTQGWDSTPRCVQSVKFPYPVDEYPYRPVVVGNTPDKFEKLLADAKKHAEQDAKKPFAVLVNAWNEWTEGCVVFPERRDGMAYLDAISRTFGTRNPETKTYLDFYTKRVERIPAPTHSNAKYGPHHKQYVNFWKAENADGKPSPTAVYIHGGSWIENSPEDSRLKALLEKCAGRGINVAAVEYRFLDDARDAGITPPVKAPLEDAASALALICEKAEEWNVDVSRIGVIGGSAGGCSSLYIACAANPESASVKIPGLPKIKAVGGAIAQTSLDPAQMRSWIPNIAYGHAAFGARNFEEWLGNREKTLGQIEKYSPYALLKKGAPKIILGYQREPDFENPPKDPVHSSNFGAMFKRRCDELGVPCELIIGSDYYPKMLDSFICALKE